MNSDYCGTFTNLLSDDSPLYNEGYDINPTVGTENVRAPRKLSKRSANFTVEEDICIVSVWLHTSKDAILGTDQPARRFWARIYNEFINNIGQNGRTEQSIKNRWGDINTECSRFVSFLNQINNRHQSGQTDHGRMEEARALYAANTNSKQFKFEHCFNLLKQEKKWLDTFDTNKQTNETFADFEGASEDNNESSVNKDRPLGRKASKEQLKRKQGGTKGGSSSTMPMSLTNERWETKMAMERERHAQRERLIQVHEKAIRGDEERKRIDGDRVEIDIMNKDTTRMEEVEASYWNMKKNEILRRNGLI